MKPNFFFLMLFFSLPSLLHLQAQPVNEKGHFSDQRERIESLKVAFFTNQLRLTKNEAEKFWPVYNQFEDNLRALNAARPHNQAIEERNLSQMTESELNAFIDAHLLRTKKEQELRSALIMDLRAVLSSEKIVRFLLAEREFRRKLLEQLRDKSPEDVPNTRPAVKP